MRLFKYRNFYREWDEVSKRSFFFNYLFILDASPNHEHGRAEPVRRGREGESFSFWQFIHLIFNIYPTETAEDQELV